MSHDRRPRGQAGPGPDFRWPEAQLKESILDPKAYITPGFNTLTVVTKDGKTIVGVQRGSDDFSTQLMDPAENFAHLSRVT